jgi:RNA polymerase I-specific transcription initiation factor RRN3
MCSADAGFQILDEATQGTASIPLTRRTVYDRLHYLLQHILSLIPTLPSTLMPLLAQNFPHKRQKEAAQITYIRNLLRISEYCPELADKILATIVDRAIQMDVSASIICLHYILIGQLQVEIQAELEELEEDGSLGTDDSEIFELDPFDTLVGQEEDSDTSSDEDQDDDEDAGFSDISSDAGVLDEEGDTEEVPMSVKHLQELVKKLDAILSLVLNHFQRSFTSASLSDTPDPVSSTGDLPPLPPLPSTLTPLAEMSPSIESPRLSLPPLQELQPAPSSRQQPDVNSRYIINSHFHTLLSIFERTILKTFKSRYTQFLLFWYTSLDPEFSDTFQGMLANVALFQPNTPAVTRAAAASYIGSFVSRAQFVPKAGTKQVVAMFCEYLQFHLDEVEATLATSPSMQDIDALSKTEINTVFYAVCQAVFLIFCFRWRDLNNTDDDDSQPTEGRKPWMKELDILKRVVSSVLNPLKVTTNLLHVFLAQHLVGLLSKCCVPIFEGCSRDGFYVLLPHTGVQQAVRTTLE